MTAVCDRPCVVDVRLDAPAAPLLRVAAHASGAALLARGRRLLATPEVTAPVALRPTALGARLAARAAPGRLHTVLTVTATDAAGPVGVVTQGVDIGPDRPWPWTYGHSRRGRPLTVLLPARPADLLVVAAIHGSEATTAVATRRAVTGIGADDLAAAVVTAANPDGVAAGTRRNAAGVDLNRNFATRDWGRAPVSAPGPTPASEPETRALTRLTRLLAPRRVLTLHAPLALVEDPRRGALARRLATATGLPQVRDVGYPTPGSLGTWAQEHGIPEVTLELPGGPATTPVVTALRRELVRRT